MVLWVSLVICKDVSFHIGNHKSHFSNNTRSLYLWAFWTSKSSIANYQFLFIIFCFKYFPVYVFWSSSTYFLCLQMSPFFSLPMNHCQLCHFWKLKCINLISVCEISYKCQKVNCGTRRRKGLWDKGTVIPQTTKPLWFLSSYGIVVKEIWRWKKVI
jgi:hypothetical protein